MTSTCLIGCGGFVGSNLRMQHRFDVALDSRSMRDGYGREFDLVVCAAPQARKWWANQHPDLDREMVDRLLSDLDRVGAGRFVLISTIDVFPVIEGVDEHFDCALVPNHSYGRHRLHLEERVRGIHPGAHIVRMPGLFGPGLKKNAIFDLLHDNELHKIDPKSRLQWYDLTRLWEDLRTVIAAGLETVVFATEPVDTEEIRSLYFSDRTIGPGQGDPIRYDVRSVYAEVFGGSNGYIMGKREVLERIGRFVAQERGRPR